MSGNISTNIARCVDLLRRGQVAAIPTETVYGLAASIASEEALQEVFHLKGRPLFDPLIVHLSDSSQLPLVVASIPYVAEVLAEGYWPGPLTLVMRRTGSVSDLITAGMDTVAVRVPRHPVARRVIEECGPLAAPSANRFGRTSPTEAAHVVDEFPDANLFVLDGGPCDVGIESTIIGITESEAGQVSLSLLRPGIVSSADVTRTIERAGIKADWVNPSGQIMPGSLSKHYQPAKPLVIVPEDCVLNSSMGEAMARDLHCSPSWRELPLDEDPYIAARTLYANLRSLAQRDTGFLVVRRRSVYSGDAWDAIWNRIGRAAVLDVCPVSRCDNGE